jgi:hypothetical protein
MLLSARFKEMRSRLKELRKHMLPTTFSPTGNYTERQQDHARGYRLLAHAEIEAYLEDVSRATVTEAIRRWKNEGQPSKPLIAFLTSYHSSWSVNDSISNEEIIQIAKSRVNIKESVEKVINLAQTQFMQRVKDNHGIKENNFHVLILPTGIDPSELDATWITNLNNFGSLRGAVAHNSKRATGQINPKDELNTVTSLVLGLEELDKRINQLL